MPKKRNQQINFPIMKFVLIVAVILCYFVFSTYKYGITSGIEITALTWAFFVFLTPVPTVGLVFELPIKLLTDHKMTTTQFLVWIVGGLIVMSSLLFSPEIFKTTGVLELFYYVLTNPAPYWSLLLLCGVGTFLSVYLMDEVIEGAESEIKHKKRKMMPVLYRIIFLMILLGIILIYYKIINEFKLPAELHWI